MCEKKILFCEPLWDTWNNGINSIENSKIVKVEEIEKEMSDNAILIPCTIGQQYYINKNKNITDKWRENILCCPDLDTMEKFNDKIKFAIFMMENNLEYLTPVTYILCIDGTEHKINDIKYPCILKPNIGTASRDIVIFGGKSDYVPQQKYYIIQEYISGTDHAANFYVKNGEIINHICFRNNVKHSSNIHIVYGRLIDYDEIDISDYLDEFSKIFKAFKYTGFACVDFRIHDDKLKIFEINPRLGGTIMSDNKAFKKFFDVIMSKLFV